MLGPHTMSTSTRTHSSESGASRDPPTRPGDAGGPDGAGGASTVTALTSATDNTMEALGMAFWMSCTVRVAATELFMAAEMNSC